MVRSPMLSISTSQEPAATGTCQHRRTSETKRRSKSPRGARRCRRRRKSYAGTWKRAGAAQTVRRTSGVLSLRARPRTRARDARLASRRRADLAEDVQLLERLARADHDRAERVLGEEHRQARLLAEQRIEALQERAAAREHDAA